ncbi:pyruvate formate lyase family protein, partial [Clostridium sp. ZBS2]
TGNRDLLSFNNFEELWAAWEKNIAYYTKLTVALDKIADTNLEEFPDIFCSSLVDDCIGRGKSIKEGGSI